MAKQTRFFEFTQNNSGGFYTFADGAYSRFVVIEAPNAKTASALAVGLGLYWDGVDKGRDCDCCGDRWFEPWDGKEGDEKPSHYGDPIHEMKTYTWRGRNDGQPEGFIHYLNGDVEAVWFESDQRVRIERAKTVESKKDMELAA